MISILILRRLAYWTVTTVILILATGCSLKRQSQAPAPSITPSVPVEEAPPIDPDSGVQGDQRYPTNAEVQQLIKEFRQQQTSPPVPTPGECCGGWEPDNRPSSEKQPLEAFVSAWSKVDPAIAPFLGWWVNNDAEIGVYPSQIKGRVCTIFAIPTGEFFFSLGAESNGYIHISGGRLGRHVLINQRNGNFNHLLIAHVYDNRAIAQAGSDIYAYPQLPKAPATFFRENQKDKSRIIQKFHGSGCTTSLPNIPK